MAHVFGLNKIKDAMTSVWGYGDILFTKEAKEINFNHNNIYPMCIVVEPQSTTPSIYDGWEDYDYTVYFCMLWKKVNRDAGPIQQKWDNIQFIGNEWLDNLLKIYNNEDLILDPTTLNIERIKNFGNDKVLAVKFEFTLQGFRTCFNTAKFLPDSFNNSNISTPLGIIENHNSCATKVYQGKGECRGWWRFDGWKEVIQHNTKRYVKSLLDMSKFKRNETGKDITHKLLSDGYDENNKNMMSVLASKSTNANEIFYGEGTNGIAAPTETQQYPVYRIEQKYDVSSNPENNQYSTLNGTEWSLGFVFEVGRDSSADNGSFLYESGPGQIVEYNGCNYYGYGISISFSAGNMRITIRNTNGTDSSYAADMEDLFGSDIYSKTDRTVCFIITYNRNEIKIWVPGQNSPRATITAPLDTSGATGYITPYWCLREQFVWGYTHPNTPTNRGFAFRNNVYEFIQYNYDMSAYLDHDTLIYQPHKVNNYWKQKYDINLNI